MKEGCVETSSGEVKQEALTTTMDTHDAPACKRVREGMCEDGGTQGRDEGEGVWHAAMGVWDNVHARLPQGDGETWEREERGGQDDFLPFWFEAAQKSPPASPNPLCGFHTNESAGETVRAGPPDRRHRCAFISAFLCSHKNCSFL